MTAVPLDTTPALCSLCPPSRRRVARPGGFTDWECHDRLADQLIEIVRRFGQLTAVPAGGQGQGRRAPGYGSKPPLNLHAAALRDPRTRPVELGEPHSPVNLFLTWGRWLRETRGQDPVEYPNRFGADPDMVALLVECDYLRGALDWVTRQEWITVFAGQVRVVVRQLRAATGEPNPRPCGYCTAVYPDGSACGHPLFPPTTGIEIQCGACSTEYNPLALVRLIKDNQAAGLRPTTTPLCQRCGHTDSQHDNDHAVRPCNAQWCGCADFEPEDLT